MKKKDPNKQTWSQGKSENSKDRRGKKNPVNILRVIEDDLVPKEHEQDVKRKDH